MSVVEVKIGARNFQLACENGQEAHLQNLSSIVSEKFENLSRQMRTGNESLLFLMTALMLQDELNEATKKLDDLNKKFDETKKGFFIEQEKEMSGAISTISSYLETLVDKIEAKKAA